MRGGPSKKPKKKPVKAPAKWSQSEQQVMQRLVDKHLVLVDTIVRSVTNIQDQGALRQSPAHKIGLEALAKAADGWDAANGPFGPYATGLIRRAVKNWAKDGRWG